MITYDEFYQRFYPQAVRLCRRKGLTDPEASAQELMLVFLRKDYIAQWYQERADEAAGVKPKRSRQVSFDRWVWWILERRVISMYRTQMKRAGAEVLADDPATFRDVAGPDPYHGYADRVRDASSIVARKYGSDLGRLFKAAAVQVGWGYASPGPASKLRYAALARDAGVPKSAVSGMLKTLREVASDDAEVREALCG